MANTTESRMILYSFRQSHGIFQNDRRDPGKLMAHRQELLYRLLVSGLGINTKKPEQFGHQFADDTFKSSLFA